MVWEFETMLNNSVDPQSNIVHQLPNNFSYTSCIHLKSRTPCSSPVMEMWNPWLYNDLKNSFKIGSWRDWTGNWIPAEEESNMAPELQKTSVSRYGNNFKKIRSPRCPGTATTSETTQQIDWPKRLLRLCWDDLWAAVQTSKPQAIPPVSNVWP